MMRALPALLFAVCSPAFAGDRLSGPQIAEALSGNTAIATGGVGTPWRQHFAADGTTRYYSGSRPASLGAWRIEGDQYCSLWPPAKNWDCYTVLSEGEEILWHRGGAIPDRSIIYQGDRTVGPLPKRHSR
ncbi:MAG: hypothetical protein AAGH82_07770 [Pseudomonadota bacterium]